MGVSVLSGAITTFGAAFFLFFGNFVFFNKFALTVTTTVIFAFVIANLTFGALMMTIGPTKGCGDLLYFCKKNKENKEKAKPDPKNGGETELPIAHQLS